MSGKKRTPKPQPARRTSGEGVPKTSRDGPETAELKAEPRRGRRPATARINRSTRTARDPEGL